MKLLKPCQCINTITGIDLNALWAMGKRGIILDLDNTITPWNQDRVSPDAHAFILEAQRMGFRLVLLSNAASKRAERIAARYNIPYVAPALKPWGRSYRRALAAIRVKENQAVAIGDQLFTDILGGNRAGCYTVMVEPLDKKEFFGTRLLRLFEYMLGRK